MQSEMIFNLSFWTNEKVLQLDAIQKLVLLNLMSNPDCPACGIYKVNYSMVAQQTALTLAEITHIVESLKRLSLLKINYESGFICLPFYYEWTVNNKKYLSKEDFYEALKLVEDESFTALVLEVISD